MSTFLTYDHPYPGPATILIETPDLPVEITLRDNPHGRIRVDLVGSTANTIQLGPSGSRGRDVRVRAISEEQRDIRQVLTTILPGAVFSQTARVGGNSRVIQCGGDMVMGGHNREDGVHVSAPLNCLFLLKGYAGMAVNFEGDVLTTPEAAARGLIRLPS